MTSTSGNNLLKQKIEALLFATQGLTVEQLCNKTGSVRAVIESSLDELTKDYEARDTAYIITSEAGVWKLTVQQKHVALVKDLIPSEFPKSLLETLAIIAYNNPAMQSEIIKIRGNKAYEHIKDLEKLQFIKVKPKGRSNELSLGDKFFEYFNTTPGEVLDTFKK